MPRELRSKAGARNSKSRDQRRRRGSKDRDREVHRDRDGPRAHDQSPMKVRPLFDWLPTRNTQHRSVHQELMNRMWLLGKNLRNIDAPPILRRVPLQAVPVVVIRSRFIADCSCPSFYCRIDGSLTHSSITKGRYVQQSINKIIHTTRYSQMSHRPSCETCLLLCMSSDVYFTSPLTRSS